MKQCPFCMGQIPDDARKCQHCGEWVDSSPASGVRNDLGRAANKYVNFRIVTGVIGLIIFLLFLLLVWIPGWNRVQSNQPSGMPTVPNLQRP
jgi:hypothetical protein